MGLLCSGDLWERCFYSGGFRSSNTGWALNCCPKIGWLDCVLEVCCLGKSDLPDDIFYLRARWKLAGQTGVAVLAIGLGFELQTIHVLFFQSFSLGLLSWQLTALWIVGMMNAVNLIDGLDGLASGLTIVALSCLATLC